jgi:nucleotide-binding universal stress UspA family protein
MNYVVLLSDRPESYGALQWAIDEARRTGASTVTVHAVVAGAADSPAAPNRTSAEALDDFRKILTSSGLAHQIHSSGDDPAGAVVDLADQLSAELVIIGIRRRSAAMKALVGSHTQRILTEARCPVVAVKAIDWPLPD